MGDSFGSWLILLVALLAGLVVGWVLLRGRRGEPPASTTASATTSEPTPAATVSEPIPAAVETETTPAAVET
ncbi:hypothetical protein EYA84_25415, partial [Verrucosispora sp. SN26_14.1]